MANNATHSEPTTLPLRTAFFFKPIHTLVRFMSTLAETLLIQSLDRLNWEPGVTKHLQTFRAFLKAARLGVRPGRAVELVVHRLRRVDALLNERDIHRQHVRAYKFVRGASVDGEIDFAGLSAASLFRSKLPAFSHSTLKSRVAHVTVPIDSTWLSIRSPSWPSTWWDFLAAIYPSGEKVLVFDDFKSRGGRLLWPEEGRGWGAPSGANGAWFLCNPVDGLWHEVDRCQSEFNPQGSTRRSEEAITSFRYLVLECDYKEDDHPGVTQDWLKFLILLPLRIVALYTSAGKSVHALVQIDAASKQDWDHQVHQMKPFLVEHGADNGALRAVQLTRLPYAYRQGRRQEMLFCNPNANGIPIIDLPVIAEGRGSL